MPPLIPVWFLLRIATCGALITGCLAILATTNLRTTCALIVSHAAVGIFAVDLCGLARELRKRERLLRECEMEAHKHDISAEIVDSAAGACEALTARQKARIYRAANRTDKLRYLFLALGPEAVLRMIKALTRPKHVKA